MNNIPHIPPQVKRFNQLQDEALEYAREGSTDHLRLMVISGLPVDFADAHGNTLLMHASFHGHGDTVAMLLEQGASPNLANDRDQTPLAMAVFKNHLQVAKQLVQAGADPQAEGSMSPQYCAEMYATTEMADYIRGLRRRVSGMCLCAV